MDNFKCEMAESVQKVLDERKASSERASDWVSLRVEMKEGKKEHTFRQLRALDSLKN